MIEKREIYSISLKNKRVYSIFLKNKQVYYKAMNWFQKKVDENEKWFLGKKTIKYCILKLLLEIKYNYKFYIENLFLSIFSRKPNKSYY